MSHVQHSLRMTVQYSCKSTWQNNFNRDRPGATRPDEKSVWTIKGTYDTEETGKERFCRTCYIHRGEVLMTNLTSCDLGGKIAVETISYEKP